MKKVFATIILAVSLFLLIPAGAGALTNPTDSLQVQIPGMKRLSDARACTDDPTKLCFNWIGEYIAAVYRYAIGIVGILATVVMMFGGFLWLTAAGDAGKIGDAKEWIRASITGLVIALSSYMILFQVNPDLIQMKTIKIRTVEKPAVAQCAWKASCEQGLATKEDGKCSGAGAEGQVCCCAACKTDIACDFCNDCVDTAKTYVSLSCKDSSACYLNKDFAAKLKTAHDNYVIIRTISEAWPPAVNHKSACHKNGECADIGINSDTTVANIKKMYEGFQAAGLTNFQFEPDSATGCDKYKADIPDLKCVMNPQSTGSHFHVNK